MVCRQSLVNKLEKTVVYSTGATPPFLDVASCSLHEHLQSYVTEEKHNTRNATSTPSYFRRDVI